MTFTDLGINSASTKDWLEAMKNQSSSGVEPRHSSGNMNCATTKEQLETALEKVPGRDSVLGKK